MIKLDFNNLKYKKLDGTWCGIEEWMHFSIELSRYIKQHSNAVKIYVSVPSNLLFSYFLVLSALDFDYKNSTSEELSDQYLQLKKGQRIFYKTTRGWVAHSILELGYMPNSKVRAIIVRDRLNTKTYIPEMKWSQSISLYEDEVTTVRNVRTVNNFNDITINKKLQSIYTKEQLNLVMMKNTPRTYIYTNKIEWNRYLSKLSFNLKDINLDLEEYIYDGTNSTFKNLTFIKNTLEEPIPSEAVVFLVGSSRVLRKMDELIENKCIYVVDLHDSNERNEDLQFKIEQDYLSSGSNLLNQDILQYMDNNNVQIPKGVEIFAWQS